MRDLFYDSEFAAQLAELESSTPRVREFLKGLSFKLRRNPEFGTLVKTGPPPIWFIGMPDIFEKALGVSYTFDDHRVILLSIWES